MPKTAYFEDIQFRILYELKAAKKSIYVAVAWLTDKTLFDMLCRKAAEGIHVDVVITDDRINRGSGIDYDKLNQSGGCIHLVGGESQRFIMHNKFCVIDSETVITGSYNWTRKAQSNHENIVICANEEDLANDFVEAYIKLKGFVGDVRREESVIDKNAIFKRLESLKNILELHDQEDIETQVKKLRKLIPQGDDFKDLRDILDNVKNRSSDESLSAIDGYLESNKQIIEHDLLERVSLLLELESLRIQIETLEEEKGELERTLQAFSLRQTSELGGLLQELFALRRDRLKEAAHKDSKKTEEYRQAEKDYHEYQKQYQDTIKKDVLRVNEIEEKELKSLYRLCCKRCHPDMVADEQKKLAARMFHAVTDSFNRNDLKKLREIHEQLSKGLFSAVNDLMTPIQRLLTTTIDLREKAKKIAQSIVNLRSTDAFMIVMSITDWDAYFANMKKQISTEIEKLKSDGK